MDLDGGWPVSSTRVHRLKNPPNSSNLGKMCCPSYLGSLRSKLLENFGQYFLSLHHKLRQKMSNQHLWTIDFTKINQFLRCASAVLILPSCVTFLLPIFRNFFSAMGGLFRVSGATVLTRVYFVHLKVFLFPFI